MCFSEERAIVWKKVPFLEECAIFGEMYNFKKNVIFLEEFDIFG